MNIYSILDNMTKEYALPFFQKHDVQATRAFAQAIAHEDPNNALRKWPEHYTLCKIGTFNEETGEITGQTPAFVITGDAAAKYNGVNVNELDV